MSVTMRNLGKNTWTAAQSYRLGSVNPYNNTTWGMSRVDLAPGDNIATNQSKTFTWTVKAPSSPGTYYFQWRMLREGVAWFGSSSLTVIVKVTAT